MVGGNFKKTKIGKIPEEWNVVKLESITKLLKSGLSRLLSSQDIGIPVIRSTNIVDSKIDFAELKYWYKNDPKGVPTKDYVLNNGDILINFINSIAHIGKSCIYENRIGREAIYTTNILRLQLHQTVDNQYFFYFMQTMYYWDWIKKITKPAVNQASFTTKDFKRLIVILPPLPEQKKIAEMPLTVDEQIEKTEAIIKETERLKKGLMQQLFECRAYMTFSRTKGRKPNTGPISSKNWELLSLVQHHLHLKLNTITLMTLCL